MRHVDVHVVDGAPAEGAEDVARLAPRTKELMRLRIAKLNGCQTCAVSTMSLALNASGVWIDLMSAPASAQRT